MRTHPDSTRVDVRAAPRDLYVLGSSYDGQNRNSIHEPA